MVEHAHVVNTQFRLPSLQRPPALHFCFTPAHAGGEVDIVAGILRDLKDGIAQLLTNPDAVKGNTAPIYGAANATLDRGMIGEFLVGGRMCMLYCYVYGMQ